MMKRIVHFFFIVTGGTIGFLYGPGIIKLMNITEAEWISSPYLGSILGAIILFLISYLLVDYIVGFLKWVEDGLIRLPIGDLFFGSLGLIIGLVISYLINLPIQDINLQFISQTVPLFLTILLGYLGFQVGFRRREELANLINLRRREELTSLANLSRKDKKGSEEEGRKESQSKPK